MVVVIGGGIAEGTKDHLFQMMSMHQQCLHTKLHSLKIFPRVFQNLLEGQELSLVFSRRLMVQQVDLRQTR